MRASGARTSHLGADIVAGFELLRVGRLEPAEDAFRRVLARAPAHPDALHGLAMVACQAQNFAAAVDLARAAARLAKHSALVQRTLGRALRATGKLDEAIAAFRRALRLDPSLVDVHVSLGIALREKGEHELARNAYQRALAQRPRLFEGYVNLENLARETGDWDGYARWLAVHAAAHPRAAEPHFFLGKLCWQRGDAATAAQHLEQAVALDPGFADAQRLLAAARGDPDHPAAAAEARGAIALAMAERAVALQPDSPQAHFNLGSVRKRAGDVDGAAAAFEEALALDAEYFDARLNLSRLRRELGQTGVAVDHARAAVALKPDSAEARCVLAEALSMAGATQAALDEIGRALELRPDVAEVYLNLGNLLTQHFRLEEAIDAYRKAIERAPDVFIARSNYLFVLNYSDRCDAATLAREHREFEARHCAELPVFTHPRPAPDEVDRVLRIGYVSADLRSHSVANFMRPILASHDRARFSVHCYFNQLASDAVSDELERLADAWVRCAAMTDEVLARRILDDRIDVLVDLSGHTAGHRLLVFARRPAPVQMTYLGYPTTTGLTRIDYRITDWRVDPPGHERFNSEIPLRLPASYFCYGGGAPVAVRELPAVHNGYVTFASFNNLAKLSPSTFDTWARVLEAVPESRLLVKSFGLSDRRAGDCLRELLAARGVAPERLVTVPWDPSGEAHLERYNECDVALDAFPYNGATTTCEALWMGVPVVSQCGERHASRMGLSILAAAGLGDLVARDAADVVAICAALARDTKRLAALRAGLRERLHGSPLMDAAGHTRALEVLYRAAWRAHCNGEAAAQP